MNPKSVFIFATAAYDGEILKRPTRADCKSADYIFAGSNPALPTNKYINKEKRQVHLSVFLFDVFSKRSFQDGEAKSYS